MSITPDPHNAPDPRDEAQAESEAFAHAAWFFRACYEGVLHIDGPDSSAPVKFVRAPGDGRLVLACPVACFFAQELVLFTPDEADDAMKLLLSIEQVEESALTDRWCAFHGEPEHVRWGLAWIDSAKHGPWLVDGDALMTPSTLAADEARALHELNQDTAILQRACKAAIDLEADEPRAVGLDQFGLDVRVRFGVVRLELEAQAEDAQTVVDAVRALASV